MNKIFPLFIAVYFIILGVFHFTRLALEWDIIVGDYYLRPWMSAGCIVLAVFVVYWIYRMRKTSNKEIKVGVVDDSLNEESTEE